MVVLLAYLFLYKPQNHEMWYMWTGCHLCNLNPNNYCKIGLAYYYTGDFNFQKIYYYLISGLDPCTRTWEQDY